MTTKNQNKKVGNFPVGYVEKKFVLWQKIYAEISSEDVQNYLLATSDFAKGKQDGINLYVTRDRLNNASFRQKLESIAKNIYRRQNPLELVFKDIVTFDAQNLIGDLLYVNLVKVILQVH